MASLRVFAPLRRPRLRRMVSAQFVSEIGDGITTVALPLYVLDRTGSALYTSLTFMVELLVSVVAGVIGGVLADTHDRQRVLIVSYMARALLLVAVVVTGPLLLAIGFGVLARAGGQLDNPSFDAMIPAMAEDDLQQVLAVRRLVQAMSITVGPAVGALAVGLIGPRQALALDAVTFVLSLLLLATVKGLDPDSAERRRAHAGSTLVERLHTLSEGARTIAHNPTAARMTLYWALSCATVAMAMATAVIWFDETLGVADAWYGIAVSGYGVGATLGLVWAGGHKFRWPLHRLLLTALPIYAVGCAMGVVADVPWLLPLGWLLWGVAMGPEQVVGELVLVEAIDDEMRGRAFAGLGISMTLGLAVGYGVAGPLIELTSPRVTTYVTSVLVLALALLWIGPARRARAGSGAPQRTAVPAGAINRPLLTN